MYKPILHSFTTTEGSQFVFRKPHAKDKLSSIGKKQELCMKLGIVPNLMDAEENSYVFEIGRLEIGLQEAPAEYWEELERNGEKKKYVSLSGTNAEQIDPDELEEVREEVNSFLLGFYTERRTKKLSGNIQAGK